MNKKVLKTMIILCWVFLGAFTLLKLIPQLASKFLIVINNAKLVEAGAFVDKTIWLQQIVFGITTFITYHFYLCACAKKWFLSWKQYLVLCAIIVVTNTIKFYLPDLSLVINVLIMVIFPFLLKADYRTFVIIFATHYLGQMLIGFIRSEPLNYMLYNTLNGLIMCLDMYIWLLLYYMYSNLYKEEKYMGNLAPPLWGKMSKEIEAEIAKLDKKLENCDDEKKRAKYEAKKAEYEEMLTTIANKK